MASKRFNVKRCMKNLELAIHRVVQKTAIIANNIPVLRRCAARL